MKQNVRLFFAVICLFAVSNLQGCHQRIEERKHVVDTVKEKRFQNHLAREKSPYLLQHADNPVDWYPWGKEAFEKAKKEDKPIFLSIGYSTCHWCHVMEHESFEDKDIAKKINEYFVPIKVDREERPDIDHIYMSAVTAMTGQGGWPLTVFLTPGQRPFWGGTYFPAYSRDGFQGLNDILETIQKMWHTRQQEILDSSISLTEVLKEEMAKKQSKGKITEHILAEAFYHFKGMYDSHFGGFQQAPKFPTSHNLSFLLRYWKRTQEPDSLAMVEVTLQKMAQGGIYDHVGGGFHRYSTDQEWQIPHFEKMLYDQAMTARIYLEVYQITKNGFYAQQAREILDYVLRDMHYPKGGFYSAEDADSPDPDQPKESIKKEGAFYLWRNEEIQKALGEDAAIFNYYSGIKEEGNAHSDPQGEFGGKNIIFEARDIKRTAKNFQKGEEEITKIIKRSLKKLFELRNHRLRPQLDDKILVDWNGLMIGALSLGARVLNDLRYQKAAEESAQFILEHLKTDEGRLLHRYRDEEAGILGTLEDYAFFIHGLLDLYETSFDVKYLKEAVSLAEAMLTLFWDKQTGGFFLTGHDSEGLLFRPKEIYDGAIPSGNSIAALDLIRLYHFTLDPQWQHYTQELFESFAGELKQRPHAYAQLLTAFDFLLGPSQEIVVAGNRDDPKVSVILGVISKYFLPRKVAILHAPTERGAKALVEISPFVQEQIPLQDQSTVYVCENHVCELPLHDVQKFEEILKTLR